MNEKDNFNKKTIVAKNFGDFEIKYETKAFLK